ncbi:MAG: hypothetical protein KAH95_17430, partial [Spirochaetales bacterium]|nr:hypothetical protein [Spirochaetales bacterium]
MKKNLFLLFMALILFISISSCKKEGEVFDKTNPASNNRSSSSFSSENQDTGLFKIMDNLPVKYYPDGIDINLEQVTTVIESDDPLMISD